MYQYFIYLPYHVFLHSSAVLVLCCNAILVSQSYTCMLPQFFMYVFRQHTVLHSTSVFLLCCPVVSLALTPYSLRPDYMLPKWIKKDVSRTEIRLDPSIFFRMEGLHVNMSCLPILQYLFHLSVAACFIIKAPFFYTRHARGR